MRSIKGLLKLTNSRHFSDQLAKKTRQIKVPEINLPPIEYDMNFICDPANRDQIHENIKKRKSHGDIDKVLALFHQREPKNIDLLESELSKLPNFTAPEVFELGEEPKVLKTFGVQQTFDFEPKDSSVLGTNLKILKMDHLGPVAGQRSYVFLGALAELEQALIAYTLTKLRLHGFSLISVPDILPTEIIRRCGFSTDGIRTLVYHLKPDYGHEFSLSGTSEMALAYKVMNSRFSMKDLPLKLASVSRCYRAEISNLSKERGLYRVHQFTKVEMFGCSDQENSSKFLDELLRIQESVLTDLQLHCRILDMPPFELGSPAYRKFDIEGWMPGRKAFGELTSCSDCRDFQSRRLNMKYTTDDGKLLHVHTLNGTACAIPRTIIAILETHQLKDGNIKVPQVLVPYMDGKTVITPENLPLLKFHKFNPRQ